MDNQEEVNVSEELAWMRKVLDEMANDFKERSESVQAMSEMFLSIISDDHTLHSFSSNTALRTRAKKSIDAMLESTRTDDPNVIKKFRLLQQQCEILAAMIEQANKEGAKIT
ncbi:MAG: hypothetical protein WBW16_01750 [Bacteroidota bacterium]